MELGKLEKYFNTTGGFIGLKKDISDLNQLNEEGLTPLLFAIRYAKSKELNLDVEQWKYLIQNSNLQQTTKNGETALMLFFKYNTMYDIVFNEDVEKIIFEAIESSLTHQEGKDNLMYFLSSGESLKLNLTEEHFQKIVDNTNFDYVCSNGKNHLFYLLSSGFLKPNSKTKIEPNFINDLFHKILDNTNFKHIDKDGLQNFHYLFIHRGFEFRQIISDNFNKIWENVIENTDFNLQNKFGRNVLMDILHHYKTNAVYQNLTESNIIDIIHKTDINKDLETNNITKESSIFEFILSGKNQYHNMSRFIQINDNLMNEIISKLDLNKKDKNGYLPIEIALHYNNLNQKQMLYLIKNTDLNLLKDKEQLLQKIDLIVTNSLPINFNKVQEKIMALRNLDIHNPTNLRL